MSDFLPAYAFLMSNEDSQYAYRTVADPTAANPGAEAISGINSAAWPEDYAAVAALPQAERGAAVQDFYRARFWAPSHCQLLNDQDLASRVLDSCVNQGLGTGVRLLQRAVNVLRGPAVAALAVDGVLGPSTAEAANDLDATHLLAAFRRTRADAYRELGGPSLAAWLARAAK